MSYDYGTERPRLFTDSGQRMFLQVRDAAAKLIKEAGAARCQEILRGVTGDSWQMLACVDRLIELGEIREIVQPAGVPGQYRIFVAV